MLNLRNVTLAAALLLAFAVSATADPYSDAYEVYAQVVAEVSDIKILEPKYNYTTIQEALGSENLVEGHSVFVTLDAVAERTPVEYNGTLQGYVHCEDAVGYKASPYRIPGTALDVPVITEISYAKVRCEIYQGVIITPTVYCQVTGDWDCDPPALQSAPVMVPTGTIIPFVTPDGQEADAEELTFIATPPGESNPRSFYAYRVPILLPWVDADDGVVRNLQVPIPYDRLFEMDVWDFKFLYEDAVKRV